MWLYYLPHAVEEIEASVAPAKDVDLTYEWPTPYHYFLYRTISLLADLVEAVKDLPLDQANLVLATTAPTHENGNIPKSSALALGACLETILSSDRFPDQFKEYLAEIVFRCYFSLRETGQHNDHALALANAVKQGGFAGVTPSPRYRPTLIGTWNRTDKLHFPHPQATEFEALLNAP